MVKFLNKLTEEVIELAVEEVASWLVSHSRRNEWVEQVEDEEKPKKTTKK